MTRRILDGTSGLYLEAVYFDQNISDEIYYDSTHSVTCRLAVTPSPRV